MVIKAGDKMEIIIDVTRKRVFLTDLIDYFLCRYWMMSTYKYTRTESVRKEITRKRGYCDLRMRCNLRPPDATPVLFRFNYEATWSRWTYPLPYYGVFPTDTLRCDLDRWPLTSNICSVSPVTWWNSVKNWTRSSNPQWSYCDFSIWPNDLEHVLRLALGCVIIFTTFDLRQLIRA